MRINYNVSAMLANNSLRNNDDLLSRSLERLSSGFKINDAKDNPAGLAMAKRMNAQIEGVGIAGKNANDGISVIETADGALNEVSDMLHRMTELAIQASTGTMTDDDREICQKEIAQLKEEVNRVSSTTEFNGQQLLDGTFDYKAYTDNENVKVSTYSKDIEIGTYTITGLTWAQTETDPDTREVTTSPITATDANGKVFDLRASMADNVITLTGDDGFEMKLTVPADQLNGSFSDLKVECTGIGAMRIQIGANEGQVLEMAIPATNLTNMGLDGLDVSTTASAEDAIGRIEKGLAFLNDVRGQLGAYQNRLEHTTSSLDVVTENMTAAYSRIIDTDMAEEMTRYSTYTVMTQAGTSVLAQANDRPSMVLQLLQ